jgi:hypothetical protein
MSSDVQPNIPDGWELIKSLSPESVNFILGQASVKSEQAMPVEGGDMVIYSTRTNQVRAILTLGETNYMLRQCDSSN